VVFQCRGQPAALHLALRVARPQANLITAVVPSEGAPDLLANLAARRRHELQAVLACP
jgi:hypothetical protein